MNECGILTEERMLSSDSHLLAKVDGMLLFLSNSAGFLFSLLDIVLDLLSLNNFLKVHFRRIIAAHTDTNLGDCSFLDTCRHTKVSFVLIGSQQLSAFNRL